MAGIYIHIPFCVQKCLYCDFVSFCGREDMHAVYIEALGREMARYRGTPADTVFIGGGTPTVLAPALLERLMALVLENFRPCGDAEYSIEVNPKTLSEEKLRILKAGGVNRLSIGVQSFLDSELEILGRIHSAADAYTTVELAAKAGFSNINLDLMSALPGQTLEKFQYSLARAVSLAPAHISCYSLILEEGTPLASDYAKGRFLLPSEEEDREIYEFTREYLALHGYKQYEISNFARPGRQCRHNLKYWECGAYLGLGAAAHSYDGGAVRRENTPVLAEYCGGEGIGKIEAVLTNADQMSEFMILGLRKTQGIQETEFSARFGKTLDQVYGQQIQKFVRGGFLQRQGGRLFLSRRGVSVSNAVMCEFILT